MIITIFLTLSVIFLGLAATSHKRTDGSPAARKAWLRIGLIFGAISLYLWARLFLPGDSLRYHW